jgi:hypothetical protein
LLLGAVTLLAAVLSAMPAAAHDDDVNGLNRTSHASPLHLTWMQIAYRDAVEKEVGADFVASGNVRLLERIPLTADGVGARVVGRYLYVTSTKDLEIFDISKPGHPKQVGTSTVDIEFENEQVPTDGRVLGLSGQTSTVTTQQGVCRPDPAASADTTWKANCLAIFDVRDKAAPKQVAAVGGSGDHTSTCVQVGGNTCAYMYGSRGSITDLRHVLERSHPARRLETNWQDAIAKQGYPRPQSCHNQTQLRPGVLLAACEPIYLISVRGKTAVRSPGLRCSAGRTSATRRTTRTASCTAWSGRSAGPTGS